jgi:hypothetical protein
MNRRSARLRTRVACVSGKLDYSMENSMKMMLSLALLLSVSACAVMPADGGGGKAGGDTVVVCHKGKKTLDLPRGAAQAHIDHGDRLGRC